MINTEQNTLRKPETGLILLTPMGHVLSEEATQRLIDMVEKSPKKVLTDGREVFVVSAREGLHPVIISGTLDKSLGQATGSIWFGQKGTLPQRLDMAWTMLSPKHHLMTTMPEMVEGMCDFLEQWFVLSGGEISSLPESWMNSLGEVSKIFDQQQAGKIVAITRSDIDRGELDEARLMNLQQVPDVINRVVVKTVQTAFGI